MNNYAIFKMGKLKSGKDLSDSYQHNERVFDVINADPTKLQDNIELIQDEGKTYEQLFEETMKELKEAGVPSRTIRKDAVKGLEVILTFSREKADDIDIQEWANKSLAWLDENFNPPNHEIRFFDTETEEPQTMTVQNIKHAIVHMDESKPHLHAFIVPIDSKGHLNSHYYNSGRAQMIQYHTEYAKAMEGFELVRGEEHSVATPEQMSRYYNHIIKAVEAQLPEPKENETVQEYKQRAEEVYQQALSAHRNEMVKKNQEIIHIHSSSGKEVYQSKQEAKETKQLANKLQAVYGDDKPISEEREREIVQIVQKAKRFESALENFPDKEKAEEALRLYEELVQWQMQQEAERMAKSDTGR